MKNDNSHSSRLSKTTMTVRSKRDNKLYSYVIPSGILRELCGRRVTSYLNEEKCPEFMDGLTKREQWFVRSVYDHQMTREIQTDGDSEVRSVSNLTQAE